VLTVEVRAGASRLRAAQQGHLAQELARAQLVRQSTRVDGNPPRQKHEEPTCIGSSSNQGLPRVERPSSTDSRDAQEIIVRQLTEEGQRSERISLD
jgi:hypothetical protein